MSYSKYIAAGFTDDAEKLFKDFAKCNNKNFSAFCDVWKKHKFGCIYIGRTDSKEVREFTSEIYQLTLNYMMSSSIYSQIAAIYFLYALYRNQDVIFPVKIRVSKQQYYIIQHIHIYASKEKVRTLHFIIDYLKKHCFEFVENCTLYGPNCSLNKDNPSRSKTDQFTILTDLRQDMTIFQESNKIQDLIKLQSQYLEKKNTVMPQLNVINNTFNIIEDYETKIQELKEILGVSRNHSDFSAVNNLYSNIENNQVISKLDVEKNDIGRRRLELKYAASKVRVMHSKSRYHVEIVKEPENDVVFSKRKVDIIKKRNYNKRIPVHKRRIGRPKKIAEKNEESDGNKSDASDIKDNFQIITKPVNNGKRGPIGRRKTSYLKNYEGPVILNSKEDPTINSDFSDESFELEF